MDKFVGMGKDILQQHLSGQGQNNQDHNSSSEGVVLPDEALKMALQHAAGANAGGSDLFANIMSVVGQRQGKLQSEEIDEQDAVRQHQQAYQNDGKGDSSTLGTAAAMQALKLFTQSNHSVSSTSGQGVFLGMAMTEASKLFDDKAAQGKVQGGASKENVVQHAVETAMKMYFKSQATSQGGLAGMAAKFLG